MNGAAAETATKIFSRKRSLPLVLFLLLLFLLPLSNAAGQSANAAHATAPLDFIVHSMETAQAAVQLPSRVRREYSLGPADGNADSDAVADVHLVSPGTYSIQRKAGSPRVEQVVKRVVQQELETSASAEKAKSTAITSDNYQFSYRGKMVMDAEPYYLLQLTPKRKEPELIDGRAWVDQHSFLIRRLEGELAKSPSWWVKSVHVDLRFSRFESTWLQTSMEAIADVRCLGAQKFASRLLDYDPPVLPPSFRQVALSSGSANRHRALGFR